MKQQAVYIMFLLGICHIALDFPMQSINYADFQAYPVLDGCPLDRNAWENASDILNCSNPLHSLKNRYHCMPNRYKTKLLEFCYPRDRVRMSPGFCFVLADNGVITKYDDTNCEDFINNSCQMSYAEANEMYKYPACLSINPYKGCYTSDPACPNIDDVDSTKALETTTIDVTGTTNYSVENRGNPDEGESKASITLIIIIIAIFVVLVFLAAGVTYNICRKRNVRCTKKGRSPEEIELLAVSVDTKVIHLKTVTPSPMFAKYYTTITIKVSMETSNENISVKWQRRAINSDNALDIINDQIKYKMSRRGIDENTTFFELSIQQLTEEDDGYYKCILGEKASEEVQLCILGDLVDTSEWVDDNESFKDVNEEVSKTVKEKLQERDIVFLVGIPGSGKTALARHIAVEKYDIDHIHNVYHPAELKSRIRDGSNRLIIFDDPFGKTIVNICNVVYFLVHFRCIVRMVRNKSCKVIFTCRKHIFENIVQFRLGLQDYKIYVPPHSYVTSLEESRTLDEILNAENNSLYILLCLFHEHDKDISTSMKKVCYALVEHFRNKQTDRNLYKYLCILICFMNENGLFSFNQSLDEHVRKVLDTIENPWEKVLDQMKSFCSLEKLFASRKICDHNVYTCKQSYIFEAFSCYLKKYEQELFLKSPRNEYKFCPLCPFCGAVDCLEFPIMENISKLSQLFPMYLEDNDFSLLYSILNQCENEPEIKNALTAKVKQTSDMFFEERAVLIQLENKDDDDTKDNINVFGNIWEDIELLRLELLFQKVYTEDIRYIGTKHIFWIVTFGILDFLDNFPPFVDNDANRLIVLACFSGKESVEKTLSLLKIKDVENVRYFRKNTESPFLCQKIEIPPLHVAVTRNNLELASYLISMDAAINAVDHRHSTAMMIAAEKENFEMLQKLIENKGNVNLPDRDSKTPLYLAAAKGNKNIVNLLLDKAASVDHRDCLGITPLSLASQNGHAEIVKLLVEKNANVNQYDNKKTTTPLLLASKNGHADVVKYLLKRKANVNTVDDLSRSPLMVAIIEMHENVINFLLKKKSKIDVSLRDFNGKSPLHLAVENNLPNVTKLLMSAKFDVNVTDKHKKTPLHIACEKGFCDLAEYLVQKSALVNKTDESLRSSLHYAVANGHLDVVELLIKHSADLDSPDKNGQTPIYLATIKKRRHILISLVKCGADVDIIDHNGVWPLDIAIDDERIFKELAKNSKRLDDPKEKSRLLLKCAKLGKDNIITYLLTKTNADVNCTDADHKSETPLYYASVNGQFETVKLLVRLSGNVNAEDSDGLTPLHVAAASGHRKIAEHLVRSGALVNKADKVGKTPLTWAKDADNAEDIISMLEKYAT